MLLAALVKKHNFGITTAVILFTSLVEKSGLKYVYKT